MRRTAPALAFLTIGLALAGCSDDDDGDGDSGDGSTATTEFCADAEAAVATETSTTDERLELIEAFAENAPEELVDEFEVVVQTIRSSIEDQTAVITPQYEAASATIEAYVLEECGVELTATTASG